MYAPERVVLSIMVLVAAYQVVVGLEGNDSLVTTYYTIAFGVLVIAGILLILFGFEILENPMVVVVAALLPLSLSLGLMLRYLPEFHIIYMIFSILGLLLILITRYYFKSKIATIVLATVHGIAGLVIFILPTSLSIRGITSPAFSFVGIGGALMGLVGLLLAFLRAGKPILPKEAVYTVLPGLLLVITVAFVIGMAAER